MSCFLHLLRVHIGVSGGVSAVRARLGLGRDVLQLAQDDRVLVDAPCSSEGRFKSFISHDGIFNWKSMYGTTEELFFVNWDLGGAYWDKNNVDAQKAYNEFNPVEKVDQWNTPIMMISVNGWT